MASKITAPADYKTEMMLEANRRAHEHGIDLSKLPQLLDMNADTITDNVHSINANCEVLIDVSVQFIALKVMQVLTIA